MDENKEKQTCTFTFKTKGKANNRRKRKASSEDSNNESENDESNVQVVKKNLKKKTNPMIQKSLRLEKKEKVTYSSSSSNDEDDDEIGVSYKSSKTTGREGPKDMGATATYDLDTEKDKDAQAVFERSLQVNKDMKGKEDDKVYRGMANYTQFIEKRDTAQGNASSGLVRRGPVRAPAHLRATVRWDYQPDICKDYKETGFCGFGDSCKFLHDRSDYKHGWQLEREMEQGTYGEKEDLTKYEIDSDSDDDLPFKCFLCRDHFKSPIITKCQHYFCEQCALKHYKKSKRCFACGAQTLGVFNPAKELITKIKERKEKKKDKGEEEDSDDQEETADQ